MNYDKDDAGTTPDEPVIPQFPTDRIELNDIPIMPNDIPVMPTFPSDRIEKGEKPSDISKKDD